MGSGLKGCSISLTTFALIFLIIGVALTLPTGRFLRSASRSSGVVTGTYETGTYETTARYGEPDHQAAFNAIPVASGPLDRWTTVQFTAANGEVIVFDYGLGPKYELHSVVPVLYSPDRPNIAAVDSAYIWFGNNVPFIVVGLIAFGCWLAFMISYQRRQKAK